MNNFNINTNFNNMGFDNSISDFNKIFNQQYQQGAKTASGVAFDDVFNSINTQTLQGNIQTNVPQTVGMDTISAMKIENLSPTEKMAQDIGQGFSKGLNDLNKVTKQAEEDLETFASGGDISVHDVMISAQKSGLAMQMAIQLRNQMLNAYNEFKNMSI